MLASVGADAGDLLEYNAQYRVLICRECRYAIQKNALESHLLRHKIYRGDRQRLLNAIAQLDLLEADEVSLPAPRLPPVAGLPVISGFRCLEPQCDHLTASLKRVRRHWSVAHAASSTVAASSSDGTACPASLQTFFRGTKIRYFEVVLLTSAAPTKLVTGNDGDDARIEASRNDVESEEEGQDGDRAPSSADLNMETLMYFHNFVAQTSLTLPHSLEQHAGAHWQTHFVTKALQQPWLMHGLLALSAHHLAACEDDAGGMTKHAHRDRAAKFFERFSAGFRQHTERSPASETAAAEEEDGTKRFGEQVENLLICAQWARLAEAMPDDLRPSVILDRLSSISSTLQACGGPQVFAYSHGATGGGSSNGMEMHGQSVHHSSTSGLRTDPQMESHIPSADSSTRKTPAILLQCLEALPSHLVSGIGTPASLQEVFSVIAAIKSLEDCCAVSFASDEIGAAWQGLTTWLAKPPPYFAELLGRKSLPALIALAHWAAFLVKRAELVGCWYLKGLARILVVQVADYLFAQGHEDMASLVTGLMVFANHGHARGSSG